MTNYNLKAARFRYYNMNGGQPPKTDLFVPPQIGSNGANANVGVSVTSLSLTVPTTNVGWFYIPLQQNEVFLVNNSRRFTVTFVCTNANSIQFYIPLRPTQLITLPSNTSAINSIQPGNLLNTAESVALPTPSTTDLIPVDFVVMQ